MSTTILPPPLKNERCFFDTVQLEVPEKQGQMIYKKLIQRKINIAKFTVCSPHKSFHNPLSKFEKNQKDLSIHKAQYPFEKNIVLSFSVNETDTTEDIKKILYAIAPSQVESSTFYSPTRKNDPLPSTEGKKISEMFSHNLKTAKQEWAKSHPSQPLYDLTRKTPCLKHSVFRTYHSETQMLRYIHQLQKKDLSLTHSMIPLGSCTMKLNGTTELLPVSWPEFAHVHPFAPVSQTKGHIRIINELEQYLCEITGFKGVSFQANAGSQGEYAGLLIIRRRHEERKDFHRKICLIPSSAHGTNPASAMMAGLQPVTQSAFKGKSFLPPALDERT